MSSTLFNKLGIMFTKDMRVKNKTAVLLVASLVMLLGFSTPSYSEDDALATAKVELSNEALHSQLVKSAIEYDTFNQRCRGVSASTNQSKVNRLFLSKYGITLNDFMMNYMSKDTDNPSDTKQNITNQVYQKIAEVGGCQPARAQGLEQQYKDNFRHEFHQVEKSTWFPAVNND